MRLLVLVLAACALAARVEAEDLTALSFEELLAADITSVAKRPQKIDEAAAAVFVISQDDIRKTGATTLPELFRYVPGMDVAEIDANSSAVSARGFNWRFSNKLLVLIDGRAVYRSVLSGVFWDEQLTPVEDIERIEVIRGPGATLYGANAVNGVINIVTKHAADTLGSLATAQGGVTTSSEQFAGRFVARQGVRLGDTGAMRLYVTGRDTPSLVDAALDPVNDGAHALQAGFRADWEPNARDAFTLQGDYRIQEFESTLEFSGADSVGLVRPAQTEDEDSAGFNIVARWSRSFGADSKLTVQTFYDYDERTEFGTEFENETVDIDVSHYFAWGDRHQTILGAGYRSNRDQAADSDLFSFQKPELRTDLFSGFIQQDTSFLNERLQVTLGSKFEYNDFTGFEVQPSARAIWVANDWSLWAAVSRAVRTPSRFETSLNIELGTVPPSLQTGPLPISTALTGDPGLAAEDLLAFEIGWRKQWGERVDVDFAVYYNDYDELVVFALDPPNVLTGPFGPGGAIVPFEVEQNLSIVNGRNGEVYGLEGSVQWRAADWWTLHATGDVKDFVFTDIGVDTSGLSQSFQGLSPNYQATLRSDFEVSHKLQAIVTARRVGELEGSPTEGYTDLDVRLAYRLVPRVELGFLGENLVNAGRGEFTSVIYPAPFSQVERRVSASVAVRF